MTARIINDYLLVFVIINMAAQNRSFRMMDYFKQCYYRQLSFYAARAHVEKVKGDIPPSRTHARAHTHSPNGYIYISPESTYF